MYFPLGRETPLRLPRDHSSLPGPVDETVYCVRGNRERSLVAAVTADVIYLYLAHPQLLLCTYGRGSDDVVEKGEFREIHWRYDSSLFAVLTSRNHILIYRVQLSHENCYNLTDPAHSHYQRQSQELFLKESRPQVTLSLAVVVNLAARATCAVALREELLVCLTNGFAHRISWSGQVDAELSIRLSAVPFAHDQLQSKPEFVHDGSFIRFVVYAPLVGGYCVVLSDGRAALLTSQDPKFRPNTLLGVWALHLRDAISADVNHKHRLLVFGCSNGDVCAYHIDDTNGALVQAFRVSLCVKDGPELLNRVGEVAQVAVLAHGSAFAVIWAPKEIAGGNGGAGACADRLPPTLAIFSPYGAQIWCSLESSVCFSAPLSFYTAVEWGPEGLQLWLARSDGLALLPMARSAALNNPVMEHSPRMLLISESRILLSPLREREASASAPHSVWHSLTPHNDYLSANWPIRFASVGRGDTSTVVIAGVRGLAHCNVVNGKWKIFGNESQERELLVTGGVFVWRGTAAAACCDTERSTELIRFYPLNTKLDNRYCSQYETEARVLALNYRDDCLVTFDVESRILLYKLSASQSSSDRDAYPRVAVDRAAEIRVGDLIPHPACLVSIHITQLGHEKKHPTECASFVRGVDTVLVNVSGRLITLNPKGAAKDEDDEIKFQLSQPIMVASFVEHIWHDVAVSGSYSFDTGESTGNYPPHLTNAIWINCGAKGMRVWLPLLPGRRGGVPLDTFIARRIMLPFSLDIRPVSVCSADCLALGIESIPAVCGGGEKNPLVLHNVHRNSEVFVHHILKELLKRNLGVFAVEIANSCRTLPYFPHALELLLHNVLEEEATSGEPIPDPLLPRIVAFVQEFPEFLRTVAHCARKTELALWPALFSVTSSPNDLFEICLRDGELQTAASYLIVLQNIENSHTSQEQAARLLREALAAGEWSIAKDMVRFTSAIDADDMDSQPRTPPPAPIRSTASSTRRKGTADPDEELIVARFQAAAKTGARVRHDTQPAARKDSGGSGRRLSKALSSEIGGPPSPTGVSNPMAEKMHCILREHALSLLQDYCIRDLGAFCAHLHLDLCRILSEEGGFPRVTDWPVAITRLHSQFKWPYPVAGRHVVDHFVRKFGSMRTSQSTASLSTPSFSEIPSSPPKPLESVAIAESITSDDTVAVIQEARLEPAVEPHCNGNGFGPQNDSSSSPSGQGRPASPGDSSLVPGTPRETGEPADMHAIDVLLCGEAASRGSPACDAQLSHMLRLFEEIGANEWVFLLSLLRRDANSFRSFLSVSSSKSLPAGTLLLLKAGAASLLEWAKHMCPGYLPILQVFDAHVQLVADANGVTLQREESGVGNKNKEQNGTVEPKYKTTPGAVQRIERIPAANGELRDAFAPTRRRERSRSVDRSHAVSAVNPEGSDCAIM